MRISGVEGTDLFTGPPLAPRQVVRVGLAAERAVGELRVRVDGPAVTTPEPVIVAGLAAGEERSVEVGVRLDEPVTEGAARRVTAVAEETGPDAGRCTAEGEIVAAATGWTMWMVSHFHYDPVWWNTQGGFTEAWYDLPGAEALRPGTVKTAFDLVRAHLDAARRDPDYKFVLAEIDYLKPYWDVFPEDRADLRRLLGEGRIEIVGGNYNEPNTNLTHPESTIRNAVYGVGYQRDVVGGDPRSAWMLDAFGHDPAYPGLMADAGLTSSAWARGPFHMWGPNRHVGDNRRMQFPSEFEWISPNGRGLLTAYMANHYGAGWAMEGAPGRDEAARIAYGQFAELKPVAATRNVLLPVGADHVVPSRWCTEIHRDWNARYVWPRFVVGLPREFFGAVREELGASGRRPSPQTRDMNPVYTGKDVSYIDTKQAQRAAEVAVLDAERLATLAALGGAPYPGEELDKSWRQLVYGAHHDGITGSESDQVYVDLLGGWREAYELADRARTQAIDDLAARVDTSGTGVAVVVVNTLSWPRHGITEVRLTIPDGGFRGVRLVDEDGETVPALGAGVRRDGSGRLTRITLTFLARDVPALGYRVYRAVPDEAVPGGWTALPDEGRAAPVTVANQAFEVTADPARGGALTSIRALRDGLELLRSGGLGGEFVLQREHPTHPVWGEGPWHLLPAGPGTGSGDGGAGNAVVRAEECAVGRRVVTETSLGGLRITGEVLLWDGVGRVDFRSRVHGSIGSDHLLRVRFDLNVPGGRPVSEVGFGAIGRPFGFPDADAAEDLWTLDNPAHTWTALGSTARIALTGDDGTRHEHAIGVAEVVAADDPQAAGEVRAVLAALAAQGVTATRTLPEGPRYGALDVDSNLPDVRIVLGGPETNPFAEEVLEGADPAYREALADHGRVLVPPARPLSEVWRPGADLRGTRDLPVLIVSGDLAAFRDDLADATIEVRHSGALADADGALAGYSVALLNAGTPGTVTTTGGTINLNLMRSCSTWPSGVWIDGPLRTAPDGSSLSWQHWSHTFRYSLVAGEGDWRTAGFVQAGQEFNHDLLARETTSHLGGLPPSAGLVTVRPGNVVLSALKPSGNPLAAGRDGAQDPLDGLTVRLHETTGRATTARIELLTGIAEAEVTDLLEAPTGRRLDDASPELGPLDVVTLRLRPERGLPAADHRQAGRERRPVFSRYWLHNQGPAPLGNKPVAVHVSPPRLDGPGTLRVTVAASGRPARGRLELLVPDELVAAVQPGRLDYRLDEGEFAAWDLKVGVDGAAEGTYYLAARIHDDQGRAWEDVAAIRIGEAAQADPLEILVTPGALALARGESAELNVEVRGCAASPVRGEAQVVSPYGTWGPGADVLIDPWTLPFEVAPGDTAALRFPVRAAASASPGAWWALVKVTAFGHLHYSETTAITVGSC
ncbi:alpha-mannosidase [Actinomadura sp. NBRC 104412]|uniref:glycoside hydrolase family 38 N-terminal domain-containing protein n=1 Tax=Actinomadura sp. NBRC 104412 TaxID=3032203 RepID=UPI0024A4A47B|nr:glycosyl hydrolase-related protein [Actinomadura sp. NBRC 104412]GLZ02783.1 alpha-mannosidase [Actinomadura sp. NBRC 104412]